MSQTGQSVVDQMLNGDQSDPNAPKKPGFFKRLFGGGNKDDQPKPVPPPPTT